MILVCGEAPGSPFNVAIALGRLKVPVGFCGRIPTDDRGRPLRDALRATGVDLSEVGERVQAPRSLPSHVLAVHTECPATAAEPSASALDALLAREAGRRLLSIDPNVRPAVIGDRAASLGRLEDHIARADLVRASRTDLELLYPGEAPTDVAERWLRAGPRLVVVTLGPRGALAATGEGIVRVPRHEVRVVDTVGAGDAFTAGILAWLARRRLLDRHALRFLTSQDVEEALAFANRVAALACARKGANPPHLDEVDAAG